MHDNRDLDAMVDEALSSYTAAEPNPSLRTRIIAHAAEAAPGQKRLWLLAPAAACAAALVIVFLCILRHPHHIPSPPQRRLRPALGTARAGESHTADDSSASGSRRTQHTPERTARPHAQRFFPIPDSAHRPGKHPAELRNGASRPSAASPGRSRFTTD